MKNSNMMCDKCYVVFTDDKSIHRHIKRDKHKLYSKIVMEMKERIKKSREITNDLVEVNLFSVDELIKPNNDIVNVISNEEITCYCGDKTTSKLYEHHLRSSIDHKNLLEIRERISLELDNKSIIVGEKYNMCSGCYHLYHGKAIGRHLETSIHEKYIKIVPKIKELLKKQRETGNKELKFCDLSEKTDTKSQLTKPVGDKKDDVKPQTKSIENGKEQSKYDPEVVKVLSDIIDKIDPPYDSVDYYI